MGIWEKKSMDSGDESLVALTQDEMDSASDSSRQFERLFV